MNELTENDDRIISANNLDDSEENIERSIRPQLLDQYIGQSDIKSELQVTSKQLNNEKKL